MKADYYETLGIGRSATAEELRQAYRRMAKEHHPDVNNGDPEADARFKAINEAYEVLRDPEKRAMYDRFGHAGVRGGARSSAGAAYTDFADLGEIFEQFFGFGTRARPGRPSAERGADLRTRLRLGFQEAVFGAPRKVEVLRRERCERCEGSGAAPGTQPTDCAACNGAGQVRRAQQSVFGSFVNVQTCPSCHGRGQVILERCEGCSGEGRVGQRRTLEVDIPAGVEDGTQIRLGGEGEHGRWGGPPGDLYVVLEVEAHPIFERVGNDLRARLRLNPADAALGATVVVPTLEGTTNLKVPAGTQTGDTFRVEQQGVPYLRRGGRGDLIVTVFVTTPEKLSREQRELLEQLRATLPGAEVVEQSRGGFWDRVRERFG